MPDLRDSLYLEIEAERHRQEAKWGIQHHSPWKWLSILMEEVGEVAEAINDQQIGNIRIEFLQCAAVCLAAVEDIDTDPRFEEWFWKEQFSWMED